MSNSRGWIGVDLDGTLAFYDGWIDATHIGEPVAAMVTRVKGWLLENKYEVRIFTARVSDPLEAEAVTAAVQAWCLEHLGQALVVTNIKDYDMVELWDDRAVQVVPNTGEPIGKSTRGL